MFQNEKVIETKTCKHCSSSFHITDKDMEFYEKVSPVFSCRDTICRDTINRVSTRKYLIPPPTLCPDCRQQRRLAFRNERKLYKRKCDATGKDIISIYSPDKPYKVYEQSYWWGDKWDPLDYGKDFDFNRGFFEQFEELIKEVPKPNIHTLPNENSDYTNQSGELKNCYLTFGAWKDEDCYYCGTIHYSKDCLDCTYVENLESCYYCIECFDSYNLFFSLRSGNCSDSYYLQDCKNLKYCFGCTGLKNKEYFIFNKKYEKEEYFNKIKEVKISKNFQENFFKSFVKNINIIGSQNSSGNNIRNTNSIIYSFDILDCENLKYCQNLFDTKNAMDISVYGGSCEKLYEGMSLGPTTNNTLFSSNSYDNVFNLIYCIQCVNGTNNCFGCSGLKNKSYCIFNKQYTKEEYETLVPKIIEYMMKTGEWGEFFPSSMSPFGYNETVAQEYYPLARKDTINRVSTDGKQIFNWSTYEPPFPKVDKIIPANKLPDDIKDIPDDILNWAIMPDDECDYNNVGTGLKPVPTEKQIKKPFRIIPQELEFYRKHNLPIPRKHPDQRHLDRMALRNPRKLFDRKCDKCGKDMKTTYTPEREEIVYCEECYNKEIY